MAARSERDPVVRPVPPALAVHRRLASGWQCQPRTLRWLLHLGL